MKKQIVLALSVGGLLLASTCAVSPALADFSRHTLEVPDGISFSIKDGERTHALRVFRDENGMLVRTTANQIETGNWSGYVLANYETGRKYTSAAGTWTVVPVAIPPGQSSGYSASWVGIGGFCENTNCTKGDGSLIQLGTESDVSGSRQNYYAWYEMLPQSETLIPTIAVKPGDVITASLKLVSSSRFDETWQLAMDDVTTGAVWVKNMGYRSSELSADWVQEAPSSASGILPLANYGTATFDRGMASGSTDLSFSAENEVIMLDPYGETSNPSLPDVDTDGFRACWGNGALAPCGAPAS